MNGCFDRKNIDDLMMYNRGEKNDNQEEKCHTRTMMHNEVYETNKMNTHVPLSKSGGNKTRDLIRGGPRRE